MFNNYNLSSHWSQLQVVALDDECDSSSFESETGGKARVSVYYEREGSGSSKVLEFGCADTPSPFASSGNVETRLQSISNR